MSLVDLVKTLMNAVYKYRLGKKINKALTYPQHTS